MIQPELLKRLKTVKNDEHLFNLGFECIGIIDKVYPSLPELYREHYYRTWIWEDIDGARVAMWDEGNTWCHFICEGTEEALLEYISNNLPLLSSICEELSGSGIEKHTQFIKEIENRLPDYQITVISIEESGTPFEHDKYESKKVVSGKDIRKINRIDNYQLVEDISFTIEDDNLIKTVYHFEPHPSCYMEKTLTFSIGGGTY